jgi:hypothetical protein
MRSEADRDRRPADSRAEMAVHQPSSRACARGRLRNCSTRHRRNRPPNRSRMPSRRTGPVAARPAAAPWPCSVSWRAQRPVAHPSGMTPRDAPTIRQHRSSANGRRWRPQGSYRSPSKPRSGRSPDWPRSPAASPSQRRSAARNLPRRSPSGGRDHHPPPLMAALGPGAEHTIPIAEPAISRVRSIRLRYVLSSPRGIPYRNPLQAIALADTSGRVVARPPTRLIFACGNRRLGARYAVTRGRRTLR